MTRDEIVETMARAIEKQGVFIPRRLASAALSALEAKGLVVLPREPTEAMMNAAIASLGSDDDRPAPAIALDLWLAALSAFEKQGG